MSLPAKLPVEQPAAVASAPAGGRIRLSASAIRSYTMVIALVAVWIIFSMVTNGIFLEARNFSNLMRQTAVTGVLAVGMVLVIVAGHIDLSVGSLVGLTGMFSVLVQAWFGWGLIPSLLTGIAVGLVVGALQGILVAYVGIPSFIVTLGGLLAWRGMTKGVSKGATIPTEVPSFKSIGQGYLPPAAGWILAGLAVAGVVFLISRRARARRQHGLPSWTGANTASRILLPSVLIVAMAVGFNNYAGVPVPVLILVGVALLGAFVTNNTVFGRYLYAIGGNPEAARLSGINLKSHVLLAFCAMGALAAVAGVIYTARVGAASPDAGLLLELDAIAACVIGGASLMGGRGTVFGACLGALLMASLDNGMSLKNVPDFIQDIVKGGILVSAVGLDVLGRRRQ